MRFSQEVSEDYQLILSERGAHSYVSTFDGHPYVAPFSGNIIELCPVGALTSTAYRFRARPWDIEGAGTICTYCPSQCNVELTVRDDRVMRVLARDHEEVDDGWLCDKGRFAYQSTHTDERITEPLVREGARLAPASWEKALDAAAGALKKAGPRAAALAGGDTTNEEAFLLARLLRDGLGSRRARRQPGARAARRSCRARWPTRRCRRPCPTSSSRTPCSCSTATRSTTRRSSTCGSARACAATACGSRSPAPGRARSIPNAETVLRYAPGAGEALLVGLDAALGGDDGNLGGAATAAGSNAAAVRALGEFLARRGRRRRDRLRRAAADAAPRGAEAATALLNLATRLGLAGRDGAGLLEIPSATNGRGIREAGFAPAHGPGYAAQRGRRGRRRAERPLPAARRPACARIPTAPPGRPRSRGAQTVIAHASALTGRLREHADVVFPAEAYAEKEGTLVHPDGRVQRLRPAIGRPGRARLGRARRLAGDRGGRPARRPRPRRVHRPDGLAAAVRRRPLLRRADARRDRRPRRALARRGGGGGARRHAWELAELAVPPLAGKAAGRTARCGSAPGARSGQRPRSTSRRRCASCARGRSSSSSPADADRLGVRDGDQVEVGGNGTRVRGAARLRASVPGGSVFLVEGTHERAGQRADRAARPGAPRRPRRRAAAAAAAVATPAGEGHAEAPASPRSNIPPTQRGAA